MRWIIGDIHGMLGPLTALVGAVQHADAAAAFIFIGDYVNRGPDSKGVIDFLLGVPNARFCRGNHDDIFDVLVNGKSFVQAMTHNNRPAVYKWFMEHGLDQTLASYGAGQEQLAEVLTSPSGHGIDDLIAGVPEPHKKFIRDLVPVIEEKEFFVTHARWDPNMPDLNPSLSTLLDVEEGLHQTVMWGRFSLKEVDGAKAWTRTGFFGHTPVDAYGDRGGYDPHGGGKLVPVVGHKIVLLDTAVALSPVGRLTAWCFETSKFIQSDRQGKIVP